MKTNYQKQQGFTLIELMIITAIVAIFAAIAVPSYNDMMKRNTQQKVKSLMTTQANELEKWRAKQFNYAGFISQNGISLDSQNRNYNYPSTGTTKYRLELVNIDGTTSRAIPTSGAVNNWVMIATPQEAGMPLLGMTSRGVKCQSIDDKLTPVKLFTTGNCGTGSTTW